MKVGQLTRNLLLGTALLLAACATTGPQAPEAEEPTEPAAETAPEGAVGELYEQPGPDVPGETAETSPEGAVAPLEPVRDPRAVEQLWSDAESARTTYDWEVAAERLEDIIKIAPDNARAHQNLAIVQSRLGRFDEAVGHGRKAMELNPKAYAAGRLAIALMARQGDAAGAESFANEVAARDAKDVDLQNLKVDAYIVKKEYLRAIELSRRLLKQDEVNVAVMKNLARAYYYMGKEATARYVFKRALELDAKDAEILYYLARIGHKKGGDRKTILGLYGKVLAVQPDFPEALNNVGLVFYETRNWQPAVEKFAEAVRVAPEFKEARLNLANTLRNLKRHEEADQQYQQLIDKYPGFGAAYYNRGLLYLENNFGPLDKAARLDKAVEYLEQYKDVLGRKLAKDDPVDQFIAEAKEMADQVRNAADEERRIAEESRRRMEQLGPKVKAKVEEMAALRARLVRGKEGWQSVDNAEKVALFEGLVSEYDEMVGALVLDLQSSAENNLPDEVEALIGEIDMTLEDFMLTVEEAFSEAPPEVSPPAEELPVEEPAAEEPGAEEPAAEEPPVDYSEEPLAEPATEPMSPPLEYEAEPSSPEEPAATEPPVEEVTAEEAGDPEGLEDGPPVEEVE